MKRKSKGEVFFLSLLHSHSSHDDWGKYQDISQITFTSSFTVLVIPALNYHESPRQ